ncbi:MAG: pentapeptide repeat-containing protein, partial [Methylovulum sp.]|nr:pentapeptide repeat-containing protein [Methylovulum sp.]
WRPLELEVFSDLQRLVMTALVRDAFYQQLGKTAVTVTLRQDQQVSYEPSAVNPIAIGDLAERVLASTATTVSTLLAQAKLTEISGSLRGLSFADMDISRDSLSGYQLAEAVFFYACLKKTDFNRTVLDRANLARAILHQAYLVGASLRNANLHSAELQGADLSGANLGAAICTDAKLSQARLRGAKLLGCHLSYADLSRADLRGADFSHADLRHANLSGADLRDAKLVGAKLIAASLQGANLAGTDFQDAICDSQTFRDVDISQCLNINADHKQLVAESESVVAPPGGDASFNGLARHQYYFEQKSVGLTAQLDRWAQLGDALNDHLDEDGQGDANPPPSASDNTPYPENKTE